MAMVAAIALAAGVMLWYALGWVLIFLVMIHTMVLTEEEHLRNTFGDEYVQYCQRVPRYLVH